jgi:RNA polymerase sigma factor (sigma-70 family)
MAETTPAALIADVLRRSRSRLIAALTRLFGADRLALAEDVVQEASLAALESWATRGVPEKPEGWLAAVARNRALDRLRRQGLMAAIEPRLVGWIEDLARPEALAFEERTRGAMDDDETALLFLCCHPALSEEAQIALTLKAQCGFTVEEIARAFLATPETIAQRLVRAKTRLREIRPQFEMPVGAALRGRLKIVLRVIYLLFNEGYAATTGDELVRLDICTDAMRFVTALTERPETSLAETRALAALMSFQHARAASRLDEAGGLVLLEDQDRGKWDLPLLRRGFSLLQQAMSDDELTAFHLEAGIASVHAAAPSYEETDWRALCNYYDGLVGISPTPVVQLNRAVAYAMADGPSVGLALIAPLEGDPSMQRYALFFAVKGELAWRNGDISNAQQAFEQALKLPCSAPERRLVERKLARCKSSTQ